jgi:predicted esterase
LDDAKTRRPIRAALRAVSAVADAVAVWLRSRGPAIPLVAWIDGPVPARADGVLVFLHGYGGSIRRMQWIAPQLRAAGLAPGVAIVLLEAPFPTALSGYSWGRTAETQSRSRRLLRSRLDDLMDEAGTRGLRVILAGFSQGAGVALDVAVEDPRIEAVASVSPRRSFFRGELPKREGLRILLAHGSRDQVCPVEASRSLARELEAAHKPARYIEFDGGHAIPPEVVRALVDLVLARSPCTC